MSAPFISPAEHTAYVTIVTSSKGPVNKKIYLKEGKVHKDSKAQIYEGFAETVPASTAKELHEVISQLGNNQAIALGQLSQIGKSFPLTTRANLYNGSIARTKDHIKHSYSEGWLLLDCDTGHLPQHVADKLAEVSVLNLLFKLVPELLLSEMLVRASSSGGIITPDGSEQKATGLHIFIKIADQSQSKQMLQLIHDRCWEAGYGFFALAADGKLLERSLVDTSVHGPERLVFETKPTVTPPLIKRNIPDEVFRGGTLRCIAEPDHEQVYYLKNKARELMKPEGQIKKRKSTEDKTVEVMAKTGLSRAKASKIVRQRIEGRELAEHDILELGHNNFMKVSDFLDDASGARGMPCPIEGSEYGTSKAYFYPSDDHRPYPRIISYAHGNITEFTFARFKHLKGLRNLKNNGGRT